MYIETSFVVMLIYAMTMCSEQVQLAGLMVGNCQEGRNTSEMSDASVQNPTFWTAAIAIIQARLLKTT